MGTIEQLRAAFKRAVYFHAVGGQLTHNSGCLAEGVQALGIPIKVSTARVTSRPVSMPFKGVDLAPLVSQPFAGFDGYIVDISHSNQFTPFEGLGTGRLAFLNQSDAASFSRVPDEHILFATHENTLAVQHGRRIPLAFGLSNGLIAATQNPPPFDQRRRAALRNFRATLNQSQRALLDLTYVPALARAMVVDQDILAPEAYLNALLGSQICLAYGGDLYAPIAGNPWFAKNDLALAAAHSFKDMKAAAVVLRWDSFRLWESFAAGCLTVHLDFDKYGFALPVKPEAWVHYAPIDLDDIEGSVKTLLAREKDWPAIAAAGRTWAFEHYAPAPTAVRVLTAMLA